MGSLIFFSPIFFPFCQGIQPLSADEKFSSLFYSLNKGKKEKNTSTLYSPHSILQKHISHYMWCLANHSLTTWLTFPWWSGNIENVLSLNPQGLCVFMWKTVEEVKKFMSFWHLRLPSVLSPPRPLLSSPPPFSSAIITAHAISHRSF